MQEKLEVQFPFGREHISFSFDAERVLGVLVPEQVVRQKDERIAIEEALENPIGSARLSQLAEGKKDIVVITSDHTRPVPSRLTLPLLLKEIRLGAPKAQVTILVATGCHRAMTREEMREKFGDLCDSETIIMHDCDNPDCIDIGQLPSGGRCLINPIAAGADLLVAEGFIEPHFFAGFSGGRKAVLPGICSRRTVLENHCAQHIASTFSRTGVLENNPIHRDMVWAADRAKLTFILNVVLDSDKRVLFAVAGDFRQAHEKGCNDLRRLCRVQSNPADIVITTNGGYPLDQNVYQAVKGMTAAETLVRENGVIIMLARSNDGVGGENFYHQVTEGTDVGQTLKTFLKRPNWETQPDQWQAQIFIRVLQHARVIYISDLPDDTVRALRMFPAHNIEDALSLAEEMLGNPRASIVLIPDGVSVISERRE